MFYNKSRQAMAMQQALRNAEIQRAMMAQGGTKVPNGALTKARVKPKVKKGVYASLRITNASGSAQQVLLFDALNLYRDQNGFVPSADVSIELTTKNGSGSKSYIGLLNRMVAGFKFYMNQLNLEVASGNASLQFDRPIEIFEDSLDVPGNTAYDSIHPSQGRNSMQQQLSLIEVTKNYKVNANTSWLYTQEPNSVLVMRFYIDEEIRSY